MKSMRGFFGSLFGQEQKPPQEAKPAAPVRPDAPRQEVKELYKKGDVIGGTYEIHGTLGKGGFGVVYLAYDREIRGVCALKTFRDDLLADTAAREAFKKEALLWVNLEQHPFILAAKWVTKVSGRLFVMMDYVAPDARGRVSLADHLARAGGPLDAGQTLKWAVQFCLGMEHANARGIKCHRDIKPANILITQDGTLKITDFGLAAAAEVAWRGTGGQGGSLLTRGSEGSFGLSLMHTVGKARCGTPGYMAPEVYRGEAADIRSDIYSFGLVLWQMATGSPMPPFVVPYRGDLEGYLRQIYEQQIIGRVPGADGFLGPVIARCLRPEPAERFSSFGELCGALEPILERKTGKKLEVPQVGEKTAAFWINKGGSLAALGRRQEAMTCLDQALAIDPRQAMAWINKGASLAALGRHEQAMSCFEQALAIDPRDARAWYNKGNSLAALGRPEEAMSCFDQALAIDPRNARAWNNKGYSLAALGRHEEAMSCFDQALAIDPQEANAWNNKGNSLAALGRHEEAMSCFDQALAIDPRDATAWSNKGASLDALGRHEEAMSCFDQALAIDARDAKVWNNKGLALDALGRRDQAIACYDQALAIDPRNAQAWYNKGRSLAALSRHEDAMSCFDQALAIDPREAEAWNNKGASLAALGRRQEAIRCYDQALAINGRFVMAWNNKGYSLAGLGWHAEAVSCFDQALAIDPRNARAWYNKGYSLDDLGRREEAIRCYDQVLAIDPRNAQAWYNKALLEDALGLRREATLTYRKFIELAPPQYAQFLALARQRLVELEKRQVRL
jgi:tetratricopeptide (TPR) repeat protein